jgi:hypothetical protein
MSWIKRITQGFSYALFLIVTVTGLLEMVFRILPTSDSLMVQTVNAENPIIRFRESRDVTKQIGFNFQHVNVKHINNHGFASDKEFQNKELQTKPVIAVIGDSYVEALQVQNKDTFHAMLDEDLENYDIYPIGMSGSPLSQYLAFSKYAAEQFSPELYVFLIIANDFDESFKEVRRAQGFHYFNEYGGLTLVEYEPSLLKRLARRSAFLGYLHLDLKITAQLQRISPKEIKTNDTQLNARIEFLVKGRVAIDRFFDGVKNISETSNVIILLDGDRNSIYSGLKQRDFNKPVNILFDELGALSKDIPRVDVVDLHNIFQSDWASNNAKFNYDYDYHWNERGHAVAARALRDKINDLRF